MVLRRKDGTPYKLRGPNKLLTNQNFWDAETTYLKNFDQLTGETVEIESAPKKQPAQQVEPVAKDRIISHEETMSIIDSVTETVAKLEPPVEWKPEPKPVPPPPEKPKSQFRARERAMLYCLPTERVEQRDPLYGETVVRFKFKEPFQFQASIVEAGDMRIAYWTTVNQVTEGSVLFHPIRRRWWRAIKIASDPQGDGVIIHCLPSDIKPDFTEQPSVEVSST